MHRSDVIAALATCSPGAVNPEEKQRDHVGSLSGNREEIRGLLSNVSIS